MRQSKAAAVGLFVLAWVFMLVTAGVAMKAGLDTVLAVALGYAMMIAIAWSWVRNEGGFRALGVVAVPGKTIAAAALLGSSFWLFNALLQAVLPFHFADNHAIDAAMQSPLPFLFLSIALVGPVAEELMFRGNLLPAFSARGKWFGVIAVAIIFSLYHLNPPQFIPAFVSGVAVNLLAIRTRSIVPGIVAHVANNAMIILVERPFAGAFEDHAYLFVAAAVALFAVGLYLLSASSSAPATPASPSR